MNWNWEEGSILNNDLKSADCKDVFHAVTKEIARYYEDKGFRYTRSRPKITYKDEKLKIEISFWSSRGNISGEYVTLEIVPYFSATKLNKGHKNGYLCGHTIFFWKGNERIFRNVFNIANITIPDFLEIVKTIDEAVLSRVSAFQTKEAVLDMINQEDNIDVENMKAYYDLYFS